MDLSLRSIKTNKWSADDLKKKKQATSMNCTLEHPLQSSETGRLLPLSIDQNMDIHYQVKQIVYALDT